MESMYLKYREEGLTGPRSACEPFLWAIMEQGTRHHTWTAQFSLIWL